MATITISYLFIRVMPVMLHEVKYHLGANLIAHRIAGIELDEVMYADDTIRIGADTRSMNQFIK